MSIDARLNTLQYMENLTVTYAQGIQQSPTILWQGPIDGMPGPPGRAALLQVYSSSTSQLSVQVSDSLYMYMPMCGPKSFSVQEVPCRAQL